MHVKMIQVTPLDVVYRLNTYAEKVKVGKSRSERTDQIY